MLLQSSNADVLLDKIRQEFRVSSVHKCPGNAQSYKILGAVTVAFFDLIPNGDVDDVGIQTPGNSPQYEEIPSSLSFLHLPANLTCKSNHQTSGHSRNSDIQGKKNVSSNEITSEDLMQHIPSSVSKLTENTNDVEGTGEIQSEHAKEMFTGSNSGNALITSVSKLTNASGSFTPKRQISKCFDASDSRHSEVSTDVENKDSAHMSASSPQNIPDGSSMQTKTGGHVNDQHQNEKIVQSQENSCQIQIKMEPKSSETDLQDDQNILLFDKQRMLVKTEPDRDTEAETDDGDNPHPSTSNPDDDDDDDDTGDNLKMQVSKSMSDFMSTSENNVHHKVNSTIISEQDPHLTDQVDRESVTCGTVLPVWFNKVVLDNADDRSDNSLSYSDSQITDSCQNEVKRYEPVIAKLIGPRTKHRQLMSTEPVCLICKAQLQSRTELAHHSEIHNDGRSCIKCVVCRKGFSHLWGLKRHAVYHFSNIFYSCPLCTRQVFRIDNFKRHFRKVHPGHESLLRIYLSRRIPVQKSKLQQLFSKYRLSISRAATQLRPTGIIKNEKLKWTQTFLDSSDSEDENRKYRMPMPNQASYQMPHQRIDPVLQTPVLNNPERLLESENIGYIPARKRDVKNFTCSFCQKIIPDLPKFMEHAHDHNIKLGPLVSCPVCLKSFKWEINLRQHASIHVLSKLYCCPVCNTEVSRVDNFKRHISMCHQLYAKYILDNFDSSKYVVSAGEEDQINSRLNHQRNSTPISECLGHSTTVGSHQASLNHPQPLFRKTHGVKISNLPELNRCTTAYQGYDPSLLGENKQKQTSSTFSARSSLNQTVTSFSSHYKTSVAAPSFPQSEFVVPNLAVSATHQNQSPWTYDVLHSPLSSDQLSEQADSGAYLNRSSETVSLFSPDIDQIIDSVQSGNKLKTLFMPPNPKRPKFLQCLFCGARIFDECDLLIHARKHRKGEDKTLCPLCFTEFTHEDMLKQHSSVHIVPNSSFACPICGSKYTRKDNMVRHYKTCQESSNGKTS